MVLADFGSIVDIGIGGDFYLTNERVNNGQGFVNLLLQNTWVDSQLWVDVGAGGLIGESAHSYVKAPEVYYRLGSMKQFSLTLGRALLDWSYGDEFWNLGITQPQFLWNQARPETQGLTGIFIGFPIYKDILELHIFTSLLFLPTQGPSFQVSNGNISSSNPWFSEPVDVVSLANDEKVNINFKVDVPKAQDVVGQRSIGFILGTPQNKKGLLFKTFYLNKPRNELILPFAGALNLTTFNGDVTVLPVVATHQVMGGDLGWNAPAMKTVFSWLYEADIDYQAPSGVGQVGATFPIYPDQNIFSLTHLFRLNKSQHLWLGYINVEKRPTSLAGVFADSKSQVSAYGNRNRFEQAARIKWDGLMVKRRGAYKVQSSLSYTHSLNRDNVWLSADISWNLHQDQGVWLFSQCDFFGGSQASIMAVDFMSTYQNNDRCFVGGHYAF